MKKNLLFISFFFTTILSTFAQVKYDAQNIKLLGTWDDPTIQAAAGVGNRYSSCWGYSQKGREYAIVGGSNGTHIIDITTPKTPKKVAFVKGTINAIWREYKTYKNFLYCASDDDLRFSIVDLSPLPDSVKVKNITGQAHTITQEGDILYLNTGSIQGSAASGFAAYDLSNDPWNPDLMRSIKEDLNYDYFHDSFVKNDTIYAAAEDQGLAVFYFDKKDKKFSLLGTLSKYPFAGYNHSSVLLNDGKHLVMLDEVPESLPIKIVDISDMKDLKVVSTFSSGSKATPHNPFLAPNNKLAVSYYEDGVQIFDCSNPAKPKRTGYFDSHYQSIAANTKGDYVGVWSVYTELPSKNLIAVDMQNGLFVLDATDAYYPKATNTNDFDEKNINIYPNPIANSLNINIEDKFDFEKTNLLITDIQGKNRLQIPLQNTTQSIDVSSLENGIFFVEVIENEKVVARKKVTILK